MAQAVQEGKQKKKKKNHGAIVDGFHRYSEDLIAAVRYLMSRGITKSSEIAKRLDISPVTVMNIKRIIRVRARRELEQMSKSGGETEASRVEKQVKKPRDVLEEILGV